MSYLCLDCADKKPKHHDPRTPPLETDDCLCTDCYGAALEDELEFAQQVVEEIEGLMAELK